jgi:hypothetical protein
MTNLEFECGDVEYHIANIIGYDQSTMSKEKAKELVMREFELFLDEYLDGWGENKQRLTHD